MIGKGKVAELQQLAEAHEADLVIFNHELTPRQSQLIGDALEVPVIDRVQLILDIFAMRARSKEGKAASRIGAAGLFASTLDRARKEHVSARGRNRNERARETKLETDRRHIRNRITIIKRELKEVAAHRDRTRQKRKDSQVFQMGLIGYTNAGKSTILNILTSADTYEQDQLFATLDPLTKRWRMPEGFEVTITDTVGFIQELPTQLIDAFHSTLEESQNMDFLLHVVDASSEERVQQEETVLKLMEELSLTQLPMLTVYNKADRIDADQFVPTLFPNVLISAKKYQRQRTLDSGDQNGIDADHAALSSGAASR